MGASQFFKRIRDSIEFRLGVWGRIVYRHAWLVILISCLCLAAIISQLPKLQVVASTEDYLHENDPARIFYDQFRRQYGRDQAIIVVVETDEVFELEFLEKLARLHTDIEDNVPKLQDVMSLVNARNTRGEGDSLIVGDLMEELPTSAQELAEVKRIAYANPLYKNNFFTHDGKYAAIVIETDALSSTEEFDDTDVALSGFEDDFSDAGDEGNGEAGESAEIEQKIITTEEDEAIVAALRDIIVNYQSENFNIYLGGSPPMIVRTMEIIRVDMSKFTLISMITIGLLLAFLFKRVVMVILPLTVSFLSVLCTLSLMAMTNLPMTIAGQIIPSFLIAVGVGNSVHIFAVFFQALNRGEGKEKSLSYALSHSGLAVIMTSLTTAGGLLSFTSAGMKPVADFGLITPIGILCALTLSLILLPALISVFPMRTGSMVHRNNGPANRFLLACARISYHHPLKVISVWFVLIGLGLFSAIKDLSFSHNPMDWYPKDDPVRDAILMVNDHFDGGMTLEMLVKTGEENGVKDPEILRRIDEIVAYAKTLSIGEMYAKQATSLSDISKEIHQALNENRSEYYKIPDDKTLLAQELLLFENSGSDDLEDRVDSLFTQARVTIKIPFTDALHFVPFNEVFEPKAREIMGDAAELQFTGIKAVMGKIFFELMNGMRDSYLLAVLVITPLMIFLIGSLRLGLISMIPNLTPIIITLGGMAWLGIPIDAFTMLIGSIALGLAVDDTIHFMHNFQRFYLNTGDCEEAIKQTLTTTGHALLFTTVVLTIGFLVYMLSVMGNLRTFGMLTGFCISMAFLADVLFAPALVTVLSRYRKPA